MYGRVFKHDIVVPGMSCGDASSDAVSVSDAGSLFGSLVSVAAGVFLACTHVQAQYSIEFDK
jgi:hypothetical protein